MRNTVIVLTVGALLSPAGATAQEGRSAARAAERAIRHEIEAGRVQLEHGLAALQASLPALTAEMATHAVLPAARMGLEIAQHAAVLGVEATRHAQLAGAELVYAQLDAARHTLNALGFTADQPIELPESFAPQDPADSLWQEGRSLINRGDFRAAARLFRRIRNESRFSGSAYIPGAYYYEAYSVSRYGDAGELRQALQLLNTARNRYPRDQLLRDAPALAASIEGQLARTGDAQAAQSITNRAASTGGQCPGEDDDVRAVAMNALLQMDAANALPILREVMARRDACSAPLRRRAVFMIAQKRGDGVDQVLLDAVRNDPDPEVREAAVFWLSQVNTPQAVAALEEILRSSTDRNIQEKALFAISQNRSERAVEILRAYAGRTDVPTDLRRNAIFWLGQRQGPEGSEFLRNLYPQIQDAEIKEHIIFAVSQARDRRNAEWLLELALREGESMEVRKKALFFAAQQGDVPVQRIAQLYDRTRDREMKEQILFALSQRTRDAAAVDKLMDIGRNETDKELRNRAIFWLSQSRDPRVAEFLLEIIKR